MKKRLLATLLCLCTLLTLLPAAAWAAEHGHNGVAFTAWTTPNALPTTAGNYYLDTDVTLNNYWNASSDVHLCLNGHTITQTAANTQVIWISNGATLTLYDCGSGSITGGTNSGVYVGAGKSAGTFCLNGGAISGNSGYIDGDSTYGGGVYVVNGSFIMNGGLIKSNTATYGGGVYIRQGSSEMNGGEITGNTAASTGGGMYVQSGADFTVTGGTIHSNTAAYGGGAGVGGAFTMRGGELRDNTATKTGGGAYVSTSGEVTLGGGLVKGAVHLLAGRTIAVTAALPTGTAIALSTATAPTADAPTQAVLGSGYTLTGDDLTAFSSLDPSYFPALNANVIALKKPPAHTHAVSVGCETGSGTQVSFQALAADTVEISASGSYYLAGDLALENRDGIAIEGTEDSPTVVDLCLNGHKLSATRTILRVGQYVTLNICDCDGSGGSHTFTSPVTGSEVTVSGGLLTGVSGSNSRAIKLDGDVNLYGGTIAGNGALDANFLYNGMVYCSGGTFHMYGGAITHNATGYNGGGIATQMGHVILEGGSLTDNAVGGENQTGGGVYLYGGPDSPGLLTVYSGFTLSGNKAGLDGGGQGTDCNVTIALDDYSKGYIRLIGNRPKAPIGVSIDGDPGVFTQGFGTRSLEDCFVIEQGKGVFLTTQGEAENAEAKLEPYAITTQPTADSPAVALNYETGATYSWHTLTQVLVDDTAAAPYEAYGSSSSYADGYWTGVDTSSGGQKGYCDLTLAAGDVLIVTKSEGGSFNGLRLRASDLDELIRGETDDQGVTTLTVPQAGKYRLEVSSSSGNPKLKVVKTTMSGALDGQTTATLTTATPGTYACRVEWRDGTVLVSDHVTVAAPPHKHAVSVDCSASEGTQVTFSALGDSATLTAGSYYLDSDKTLTAPLTVPDGATVDLCLNGHALTYVGTDDTHSVITVGDGATLNLCDCDGSGGSHTFTSPVTNEAVTISGGLITGAHRVAEWPKEEAGGAIYSKGNVNLYGGTVAGNTGLYGGGVYLNGTNKTANLAFTMYGGQVCHNKSTNSGGGVYLKPCADPANTGFVLHGGEIHHNKTNNAGGGVNASGTRITILMDGGSIHHNTAKGSGGGLYSYASTTSLLGGSIHDNTTESDRVGGVYPSSSSSAVVTLGGGMTITGNTAAGGAASNLYTYYQMTVQDDFTGQVGIHTGNNDFYLGRPLFRGAEGASLESKLGQFCPDVPGQCAELLTGENAGKLTLSRIAITTQPTADTPTVGVNYAPEGISYQWYTARRLGEAVTDQNATPYEDIHPTSARSSWPIASFDEANGTWTSSQSRQDDNGGYFVIGMKAGDALTVTIPADQMPQMPKDQTWALVLQGDDSLAAYFDPSETSSEGVTVATGADGAVTVTYLIPADGEYTLMAGRLYYEVDDDYVDLLTPVISAVWTHVVPVDAVTGQTAATLSAPAPGDYLCQVAWPDGTVLNSRPVTFAAPPHKHAMSVGCEAEGEELVTFDKALTSVDGVLYVDGTAVPSEVIDMSGVNMTQYHLPTGHYYLPEDVTLADKSYLFLGGDGGGDADAEVNVDLCLNGHVLNLGGSYSRMSVAGSAQLRVCDCGDGGAVRGAHTSTERLGAMVNVTGVLELYGGTVENTATPGQDEQARAVALFFGVATLHGGQVIAGHDTALQYDASAAGLTLYDGVTLQGGADSAEMWLSDVLSEENDPLLTIAQPLTRPEKPWRLTFSKAQVFTDGWAQHMAQADFNDYFTCIDQGRFLEKNAQGELAVVDYAITTQPTAQAPTVAVNYTPQGVGYQWYPATVSKKTVATEDSDTCVRAEPYEYITGSIAPAAYENGKWTAAQSSEAPEATYFTVELQKGDKVALTLDQLPTQGQLGLYAYGKGQLWYYFGGTPEPDKGVSIDGSVITYVIPTDGEYKLMLDGLDIGQTAPALSAQLTRVTLGEAVSGQTTATLAGVAKGDYLCRVTWPDGTVIDSDVVTYTPPHVHDWGKWILQADKKTLTRVCAGNAGHTESQTLSYGLPNNPIVYDGTEKKPAPSLKTDGNIGALTGGTDYTVSYKDNVNAGTGTVTVTGAGDFSFTLEMTFTIQKADQAAPSRTLFDVSDANQGQSDGAIAVSGDVSKLEYRPKPADGNAPAWIAAAASIGDLSAGWYQFRCKATDNYNASPVTELEVRLVTDQAKALVITEGIEHGSVSAVRKKVNPGDTVKLTVTPDPGYALASLTANYGEGQSLTPTWNEADGVYTFIMPDAPVTVTATFAPVPPEGDVTGEVVLKGDTPRVTVDQDALKELAGEVVEGDTVTVKLTVEKQDAPTDKDDIQAVVTGKKDDVLYLDFSLLKQVNDGVPEAITDTRDNVLEIKVPYDFTGKKDVSVYRKHGDTRAETLSKLAARPAGDFQDGLFYADRAGGAVYIYASKFSTYAIAYTAETTTPSGGGSVGGYVPPTVVYPPNKTQLPFTDVKTSDACYESVKYVYEKGWMLGTSDTTFDPNGQLTRAMLATVLYRMAGSPEVEGALAFEDTLADTWYSDAVLWAAQTKTLRGYGNGKFGPEDPVSKEMMNMVTARRQGEDPAWVGDPALAIPATRAEIAAMLMEYGQDEK